MNELVVVHLERSCHQMLKVVQKGRHYREQVYAVQSDAVRNGLHYRERRWRGIERVSRKHAVKRADYTIKNIHQQCTYLTRPRND